VSTPKIKVGDRMPAGTFMQMTKEGPRKITTDELFKGKRVVLFAVPGAFTPTCEGIDTIACMAVNDVFVMDAWGKHSNATDKVIMLADGNGDYTKALGLEMDGSAFGLGMRSQRFSMLVEDGVIKRLNVEEAPGEFKVSSAEHMLGQL
jgi:peroxiredoxin